MIPKKIVIFGFPGLGDMIEFSPCFRILREGFSNPKITLVTVIDSVRILFEKSPYIDEVIFCDWVNISLFEKIKFINLLWKRHFDISILPFPSYRREFNLFSGLIRAKNRYSFRFNKGRFSEFTFLNNHLINADSTIQNVENNLQMMKALGLETKGKEEYDIPVRRSGSLVESFFYSNNINESDFKVGIHPGSDKRGMERRLPISKFAEISDYLSERYKARVIIFLGPHEDELKKEFLNLSKKQHIIVENMDIDKIAQLISVCNIFISGDSGLMHIASAMKVPSVAIFGPTNPVFVRPWRVQHEIVRLGLDCSPCFLFTDKRPLDKPLIECKIDEKFACIKRIESEDVLEKVNKMVTLLCGK